MYCLSIYEHMVGQFHSMPRMNLTSCSWTGSGTVHGKGPGLAKTLWAWELWRERRRVLIVLAVVELSALVAPLATWSPLSRTDLDLSLMLASLSLIYSPFVIGWEKARRHLLFERSPAMTPNVLATWCFAGAILLPPIFAAAVTAISEIGGWPAYNPAGTKRLYRFVFYVMTQVLAATATSEALRLGLSAWGALPIAAVTWITVGPALTIVAMCASGQFGAAKAMLHPRLYRLEIITMAVAIAEYSVYKAGFPLLMWLSLPAAVVIQRYFTTAELRSRELGARPMDEQAWLHVAKVVVEATVTASVLRIDTSDPQTARMVAMMQGGCDAIGTYADGGLAILLPDCPPAQGDALARRLRIAMKLHKVECNIAAASKPRDGQVLDDLLAVSEAMLVLSREASRRSASSP